jgi:hypothetical protein
MNMRANKIRVQEISFAPNLDAELLEVVVDVLVHPHGPFIGREAAEEAVGMRGAAGRTAGGEAVDNAAEFFAFTGEVAVVSDGEAGNGGRVAPHGFAFLEGHRLDRKAEEASDQHARRTAIAQRKFHSHGAVGDGLSGRHLAPLARAVGAQVREALFQLLHGLRLKQVLHGRDEDSRRSYQRPRPSHRDNDAMNEAAHTFRNLCVGRSPRAIHGDGGSADGAMYFQFAFGSRHFYLAVSDKPRADVAIDGI